ncbi:MAG: hypothetical protein OEV93_04875 [Candidatus Moranbacteria bacterium]|nr:hypothetical protein [Candidatus Moranbacteria bacterium]
MEFIQEQFLFYLSLIVVMFVPGFFLLTTIFQKKRFSQIEALVFSITLSIISVDFLMIVMGKMGIPLNFWSVLSGIALFSAGCFFIQKNVQKKNFSFEFKKTDNFSKNQTILIVLILFLAIFVRTAHLKNAIFPTATDLGHHMYWSKLITETGELPVYEKQEIEKVGESYQVSEPSPIADFIIGEHLIFAAISLLSGVGFVTYFPTIILFLVNIAGILTVFVFTLRLFENDSEKPTSFSKNVAIATLLFLGPLYAISSPQSTFVSGGVVGNMIGNLLIPSALYFYFKALKENDSWSLFTGIFLTAGMIYTHHLSSFIFIYIFAFIFITFNILFIFNSVWFSKKKRDAKKLFKDYSPVVTAWVKMIFSKNVFPLIIAFLLFFFFVFTPAYIETSAVDTAIGAPSKSTRAGLSLTEIKFNIGESRMLLATLGVLIILLSHAKKKDDTNTIYSSAFALGWFVAIFSMITIPETLHLNLPSGRIASYFVFPASVLAGFSLTWIFWFIKITKRKLMLPASIISAFFFALFVFVLVNGMFDNSESFENKKNYQEANRVYHASKYLAGNPNLSESDIVLKDHNYLKADTWMKIFFMRDYNFPFSRSYFKRYEDPTKPREMCTLWMISNPTTTQGEQCFEETGVNFLVVNPKNDTVQFKNANQFNKIYSGNEIVIYYRKN